MSFRAPNIFFKKELLDSSRPLYLALSSGVDSIACAYYLLQNRIPFTAWHFDHRIRIQNRVMAKFAQKFCKDFGIQFKLDYTPSYDDAGNLVTIPERNVEEFYRTHRMNAMRKTCNGGAVIFAHHLNDMVESYCMDFMTGGSRNMIPPVTIWKDAFDGNTATVIRPFLLTKKAALQELCMKHDLMKYVIEDETNVDTSIRRNWVRHSLIPLLETQIGIETVVRKKVEVEYDKVV